MKICQNNTYKKLEISDRGSDAYHDTKNNKTRC